MFKMSEAEIINNWNKSKEYPTVSICTITYNHEKFISEAIDSFLKQKTKFSFEIIIDDDCSTDNTASIIRNYIKHYPNIIKANLRKNNIGMMANFCNNIERAKGKFIALCEGDDYWIDPLKLQKQVEFLEKNNDMIMTFHNARIIEYIDDDTIIEREFNKELKKGIIKPESLYEKWIIPTASVLFRNMKKTELLEFMRNNKLIVGDHSLFLFLGQFGKIYYYNYTMSIYRILKTGAVKSSLNKINSKLIFIEHHKFINKYFKNYNLLKINNNIIEDLYFSIAKDCYSEKKYFRFMKYFFIFISKNPSYFVNILKKTIGRKGKNNDL